MQYHYTPYILPPIVSTIIASCVAIYAWQRRANAGDAKALAMLALASAVWSLGYTLEVAGDDLQTKMLWGKGQYIGIGTVTVAWNIQREQLWL